MGIFDGIGDKISDNSDKIKGGIDKVGDFIDEKTGDKYKDKVDQGQDFAREQVDKFGNRDGAQNANDDNK